MSNAKTVMSQAANTWAGPTFIEDVFSTYLYTGNGSTQTITNGIDLAGEGGLVWSKCRSTAQNNHLVDSVRGTDKQLYSNLTNGESSPGQDIFTFNSDGYDINLGLTAYNTNAATYASWTFRKAPRFFDVVTYTGTGSARTVSHNLGVAPGCIIAKNVSRGTEGWRVYHRSQGATKYAMLQSTNAFAAAPSVWNNTEPTDSVFTAGSDTGINGTGDTIVAYLFAHDPLGPSGDGSDGLIACGSYTGTGAAGNFQDLGWEPQYVLVKGASDSGYNWIIHDVMRGMSETTSYTLKAEASSAENLDTPGRLLPRPTGFEFSSSGLAANNASGVTYIYIAIRRGPMRQPTSGTEVFAAGYGQGTKPWFQNDGWPVDMLMQRNRNSGSSAEISSRLTQERYMFTNLTNAEATGTNYDFDYMNGAYNLAFASTDYIGWMFRRAPGFFDVVAYTGDGTGVRTHTHNLGVTPEMYIIKKRNTTSPWYTYHNAIPNPNNTYIELNSSGATSASSGVWGVGPTSSNFQSVINTSGQTHIAYLFATLPGVSKVGSYTGNGTSQTIDCGFTSGARFVLIKRTDSTGDWYVWDTARGIVAANDPHLSLNTTAAEVTTNDSVDPDSSGFIVNQVAATNINVNAANYIFYAIA